MAIRLATSDFYGLGIRASRGRPSCNRTIQSSQRQTARSVLHISGVDSSQASAEPLKLVRRAAPSTSKDLGRYGRTIRTGAVGGDANNSQAPGAAGGEANPEAERLEAEHQAFDPDEIALAETALADNVKRLLLMGKRASSIVQLARRVALDASVGLPPLLVKYCSTYRYYSLSNAYEARYPATEEWPWERVDDRVYDRLREFARDIMEQHPDFALLIKAYHKFRVHGTELSTVWWHEYRQTLDTLPALDKDEAKREAEQCARALKSLEEAYKSEGMDSSDLNRVIDLYRQHQASMKSEEMGTWSRTKEDSSEAFVDHLIRTKKMDWDSQIFFGASKMRFVEVLLKVFPQRCAEGYELEGKEFSYGFGSSSCTLDPLLYLRRMLASGNGCELCIAEVPALSDWTIYMYDGSEDVGWELRPRRWG